MSPEPGPPFPTRVLLADFMGGLLAAEGVLAGLLARERTRRPQRVETSLVGGAMALQSHVLEDLAAGREHRRRRGGRPLWGILDHPVPVADGYLALSAEGDPEVSGLWSACGAGGPLCAGQPAEAALTARFTARPGRDWEQVLSGAGIPCAAVREDLAALCTDPRMAPVLDELGGGSRAPSSPWRFSR